MVGALALLLLLPPAHAAKPATLEALFQLPLAPAGLTMVPNGHYLLSVSFEQRPQNRIVEINKKGESKPFPNDSVSQAAPGDPLQLDSIEGMQADKNGIVWMIDHGRRSEIAPKVVAWDYDKGKLHRVIHLGTPAILPSSLLDDLVLDPETPYLYIGDPASGPDAALIVLDLTTGMARRVLQGHPSVLAVPGLELIIDQKTQVTKRLDGTVTDPRGGINPIAIDRKGEWLYFGPMRSTWLYRLRTEHLRNASLTPEQLASHVEQYASKPLCNGITLDSKNNIYVSDLAAKGIGMIAAGTKQYSHLITDPRLLWPDGLCFGTDGKLYFFNNASKLYHAGASIASLESTPPAANYLFRIQTPASGRVGD
jgi:sugar lactone lactonase YvrE